MEKVDFLETPHWSLAPLLGKDYPSLHINSETVIHTWIIIGIILLIIATAHFLIKRTEIGRFIVLEFVSFFIDLTHQSFGTFIFSHCVFAASLFVFIALCNIAPIIPWLDEPTKDLNTTLALGLIVFFYTQKTIIQHKGISTYIGSFFKPFFVMMPLNIISKLSSVISLSFRLFGNIFGGSIITGMSLAMIKGSLLLETLFLVSGINLLLTFFFTLFEGILQAFVFSILAITYIAIGIQSEGH